MVRFEDDPPEYDDNKPEIFYHFNTHTFDFATHQESVDNLLVSLSNKEDAKAEMYNTIQDFLEWLFNLFKFIVIIAIIYGIFDYIYQRV